MMTAANRETAVLAVQTVKEVSNMGNRPVNRSRRSAGRGRYSSGRSRSSTLRRRRRNRRLKNVLIGLCCILLVVLLVFGVGKLVERFAGPGKTQLRKEGIEKLNSGDLEGAVADFDQALEKAGNKSNKASAFNADVLWYRAEAEMFLADYEAASHTYDLVAEQGGDKISSLYMKAVCAGKLEDKDQAVSYYREALGMEKEGVRSPGYEEALIAAGSACVKAQDYETAKSLYEEALNSGKTGEKLESRIYNQLGLCQMAEEDYETAADTFDKGYNALITGYKAGTGAELDQAAAAIPKEDTQGLTLLKELAYNKAVCLEYRQQYRQAQAEFETYIKVFGDDEDARHEIDFLKTRQEE